MLKPEVQPLPIAQTPAPWSGATLPAAFGQVWARGSRFFQRYLITWCVPVLIVVIWQVVVDQGLVTSRFLPTPLAVLQAAWKLLTTESLFQDVWISTQRALSGLVVGGGIGFLLGILNGVSGTSEKLLDSTLQMIRTIPHLALMPLVILWFGIGDSARLFLIALGVFFPMYVNTFHGIRQVDAGLIEMGKVYGLSRWQLFGQIILPGALPSILLGLRLALGVMWLTLIVAETIAANAGIGYMTSSAREFIRVDVMLFAVVLYALLGKWADAVARLLERSWLRWHPNYQR